MEPAKPLLDIRALSLFSHYGFVISHFSAAVFFLLVFLVTASAQPTQTLMLSGHGKDDAVPWKFFCTTGAHSGYWTNLVVPSNWELHGFGALTYHRDPTNPESGLYEHDFKVARLVEKSPRLSRL